MAPDSEPPHDEHEETETRKSPVSVRDGTFFIRNRPSLIFMTGEMAGKGMRLPRGDIMIGRSRECSVRLNDEGVSRRHAAIRIERGQVMLSDLGSRNGTVVNGKAIQLMKLNDGDKIQLGPSVLLKFTYTDPLDESLQEQLYSAAMRDPLTRVFNRAYLNECLEKELAYARRHSTALCVIMLDVDFFKQVNDTHGHVVGDDALKHMARVLLDALRTEDTLARYGGEEFCVICRGVSSRDAMAIAERLRRAVEGGPLRLESGAALRITVSIGLATFPEVRAVTATDFIKMADFALGRAKERGRNRVVLASVEDPLEITVVPPGSRRK